MKPNLHKKYLLPAAYVFGAFFAARCMLFDILCPCGGAYLAFMLGHRSLYLAAAASAVGVFTRGADIYVWGYIGSYLLIALLNVLVRRLKLSLSSVSKSVAAGLIMTVGGVLSAYGENLSLYYLLLAGLQGILSALLTLVFTEGVAAFRRGGVEILGVSLLIGIVCGGMGDINLLGIPLALIVLTIGLPFTMCGGAVVNTDGKYVRQSVAGRIEGFAKSLDRLAFSMSAVTDKVDDFEDTEGLKRSLKKSRSLLSGELRGLSALLKRLVKELKDEKTADMVLSTKLKDDLRTAGVRCEDVLVYRRKGRYEVSVAKKRRGSCDRCIRRIISAANKSLGVRMSRDGNLCRTEGDSCILRLCEERPYRISVSAAVKKRDGSKVSGDSYTFMELGGGIYMLALSDGMGSGGKAKEESAASVELFEDFMEAGFERDMVLEQLNSLLLMKAGGEDIFATLDICNINLYDGSAEFVKIGGMPSYLITEEGVRMIGGGGLPIGIMDSAESNSTELRLSDNDVIVMVTDGVTEAAPCLLGKEKWFAQVIEKYSDLQPDKLCDKLLEEAVKAGKGRIRDDMTVIAAKIWRVC